MTKTLEEYTKDELIEIIQNLKRRKKFGLVWEEKPEEVVRMVETQLPVIEEVEKRAIDRVKGATSNVIIEGDNYHALSVLNYTHAGKVDVIYIDPPYNTGNKSWKYNNHYIEADDTFKHSKWSSFMYKRLVLCKSLLREDGIIIATIDDYEAHILRLLLDEVFGEENRLSTITVVNKKSGRTTDKFFATSHEYYYFYAKSSNNASIGMVAADDKSMAAYRYEDTISKYKWRDFLRTGGFSTPEERPNSHYPIYYDPKTEKIDVEQFENAVEILPIDTKGNKRVWRQTRPSLMALAVKGDIVVQSTKGGYKVRIKDRIKVQAKPKTVWDNPRYDAATHGTKLLEKILGKARGFDFPKSLYAVKDALQVALNGKTSGVVLDFFAGSGTTGHAVMQLNKENDSNYQFILCTNNENGIAEEVTYPRIKNVIDGYAGVDGIATNLRYFKTSLVSKQQTDDQTRIELVARSTDMICLREDTFEKIIDTKLFKVFSDANHYAAIVFEPDAIVLLKDALAKLKDDKAIHIYVFSLSNDTYESDFTDLNRTHELRPIPESILEVYRRIHKIQNEELGV